MAKRGNVSVTAVASEMSDGCRVQVRQGQGVTKAKGERQLEPRDVGPGTGNVMPQMPGYLAHYPTQVHVDCRRHELFVISEPERA